MRKFQAVILHMCDNSGTPINDSVVGVYTNMTRLRKTVSKMIRYHHAKFDPDCQHSKSLSKWDVNMMNSFIKFIHLEKIYLNEERQLIIFHKDMFKTKGG